MQLPGRALRRRRRLHDRVDPQPARDHPPEQDSASLSRRHAAGRRGPDQRRLHRLGQPRRAGAGLDRAGGERARRRSRSRPLPLQPMQPVDDTTTGTVTARAARWRNEGDVKGWSRAGGTRVTVKEGETVYNLSRRFGVPADVIMKSNGLSESDGLKAGSEDRHPDLCLFGQGAGLGPRQQSEDGEGEILARRASACRPAARTAAEPRGAAADAEEQGKVRCDDHGDRRQQQCQASGRRRHLQGAGRRHAVAHRQEDRRRRHRHQGGERPRRRPDPHRPDAEDPGRRRLGRRSLLPLRPPMRS